MFTLEVSLAKASQATRYYLWNDANQYNPGGNESTLGYFLPFILALPGHHKTDNDVTKQ